MKRLFVAIKVKPDSGFIASHTRLKGCLSQSNITWVSPSVMHLTLKFLGNTGEESIETINGVLAEVAGGFTPFEGCFDKLGIFGSAYQPRVIWLGTSAESGFGSLGNAVLNRLDDHGFLRDRQNFVPHITLGRIKQIENKKYFNEIISRFRDSFHLSVVANQLGLYHSELTPSGPRYHEISTFNIEL
ncbi:MAG: RNA 2',3'-cyclic phosphodiesterase [Bacteroidales bacterium]|nr:RNA 2',3'-cyclic phosphodiesterase [Bacteroidales bacterium]